MATSLKLESFAITAKRNLLRIAPLILCTGIIAPGMTQTPTPTAPATTSVQTIQGEGWSFIVPANWENPQLPVRDLGAVRIQAQAIDPNRQVLVNLVSEPYQGDRQQYLTNRVEELRSAGFTVHNQRNLNVGSLTGSEVEFTLPSNPPVRMLQRITTGSSVGYALTCGSIETNFETARSTCDTILNTFNVTP